jgi:voltage-gated potassium channel
MNLPIRQRIFNFLEGSTEKHVLRKSVQYFLVVLILLSVLSVVLESFQELRHDYALHFLYFEVFSVVVFSIEYFLRLITADYLYPDVKKWKAPFKFLVSTIGLIDLLAILPFYLPLLITMDLRFIRLLRLFRLFRLLKLVRYSRAFQLVGKVVKESKTDLMVAFGFTFGLILFASTLMYYIENEAQPEGFSNVGQAMWWAIATLTTVGYGDIYPITPAGRLLASLIALLGIGLVALPAGILSSSLIEKVREDADIEKKKENTYQFAEGYNYCPFCGKKLPLDEEGCGKEAQDAT